ncbi:transcriptional repressor protein TyrR [Vibrio cholerae]|nr:transcriptional repressor protein TyrR [Vibrio cholerae]
MTDDLLDKLSQYQWPGNMRQLDNMVASVGSSVPIFSFQS